MIFMWKVSTLVTWSKNKPKRSEHYLVIWSKECSTKWDMHHKLCVNSRIFHGQSFINIFSKSILWYNVVILTIVSRNLAIILEILELYTHLSTNLSNCPYCVTFINHKQKIRYFGIIWQPVRPEFVLDPNLFTKTMKLLGSMYHR